MSSIDLLHYGANERKHAMLEKLGGRDVLNEATHRFYDRQVNDERLLRFFHGTDLTILKWHQFNLMSIAFTTVPKNFDVRHLILNRHQRLFDDGLDESYFDVVMDHFVGTLEDMNIDKGVIDEAMKVILPLRDMFAEGAAEARKRKAALEHQQMISRISSLVALGVVLLVFATAKKSSRRK